jgi:hypothetical protein
MQTVLKQQQTFIGRKRTSKHKVGFLAGLFGCRHKELTRPFTVGQNTHRSCTDCGAWRDFNPDTLETYGKFYYPMPETYQVLNRKRDR